MLTSMRNMVTSKAIRPGTISTGIKNPMNDAAVSRPVGRKVFKRNGFGLRSNIAVKPLREMFLRLLEDVYHFEFSGFRDTSNFALFLLSSLIVVKNFWNNQVNDS